jgi:hypothetical protein
LRNGRKNDWNGDVNTNDAFSSRLIANKACPADLHGTTRQFHDVVRRLRRPNGLSFDSLACCRNLSASAFASSWKNKASCYKQDLLSTTLLANKSEHTIASIAARKDQSARFSSATLLWAPPTLPRQARPCAAT